MKRSECAVCSSSNALCSRSSSADPSHYTSSSSHCSSLRGVGKMGIKEERKESEFSLLHRKESLEGRIEENESLTSA